MVLLDLGTDQAPSWLPFTLALILLVVLALLWFSMSRHLKKADYPDEPDAGVRDDHPSTN